MVGLIKVERWLFELIEDEHQDADRENQELHRDLEESAENQAHPALPERPPCQIALHLALVAPEIGQKQEKAAQHAGQKRVRFVQIQRQVYSGPFPGDARDVDCVSERNTAWKLPDQEAEGHKDSGKHQYHLLRIDHDHGLVAADSRIEDCGEAHDQDRGDFAPTEDHPEHDSRGIEHDTHRKPSGHQKEKAGEASSLGVKAPFQVFVCGEDVGPIEKGDKGHAQDHHDHRLGKIKLDKSHSRTVGLSRGPDVGDRAGLCRHDRETDGPPAQGLLPPEVIVEVRVFAPVAEALPDHVGKVENHDNPVGGAHCFFIDSAVGS